MPAGRTTHSRNHETLEQKLWKAADKLRKNIDAAEYKHIVLGLIFLKYISDAFDQLHENLVAGEGEYAGADPEDADEYRAENVFFVPIEARWPTLQAQAKQPDIGQRVDEAMAAIEQENPKLLKGILPKVYGQQKLDPTSLGGLIDLVGSANLAKGKVESDGLGYMVNRRNRSFAEEDIQTIANTYHNWKQDGSACKDIKGFCKSATLEGIQKHNFVLTPGRYVGIPDEEDDGVPVEEKMAALTAELAAQMKEAVELDQEIKIQLTKVGFDLEVGG